MLDDVEISKLKHHHGKDQDSRLLHKKWLEAWTGTSKIKVACSDQLALAYIISLFVVTRI